MNLKALSCTISQRVGGQSVSKTVSIPFVVHGIRDMFNMKWELLLLVAASHVSTLCLLDVTALDQISQEAHMIRLLDTGGSDLCKHRYTLHPVKYVRVSWTPSIP